MAIRPLPYFAALAINSLTMKPSGIAVAAGRLISMLSTRTCSGRSSDAHFEILLHIRNAGTWNSKLGLNDRRTEARMSIGTIILIILVIALLGGFSGIGGGPFYGTGYYGGGGLGLIIVILVILLLLGKL